MTCCVGLLLKSGLLFASDSRTPAGVDNSLAFSQSWDFPQHLAGCIYRRVIPGDVALTLARKRH